MTGQTQRRKRAPRFIEIAREAGVSPSTVDRVLNERDSVSESARARVIAAAQKLGVARILPGNAHALVHIDVLLPDNRTPFFQRLRRAFSSATTYLDKRFVVHRRIFSPDDEDGLIRAIRQPPYRRHGIIAAAPDRPSVREALREVREKGAEVATIVSQIAGSVGFPYLGIDNYRAGRTAGLILSRFARTSGRVIFLSGGEEWDVHVQRNSGCRDVLGTSTNLTHDSHPIETRDDETACYEAVAIALRQGGVVGIYNSGEGSSGIVKALERYDPDGLVTWVTHELSDNHQKYLAAGRLTMVIDQNPDMQATNSLRFLLETAARSQPTAEARPCEFRLYFSENIGDQSYL